MAYEYKKHTMVDGKKYGPSPGNKYYQPAGYHNLVKVKNVKSPHFLFSVESTSPLFYRLKCKCLIERGLQILELSNKDSDSKNGRKADVLPLSFMNK